MQSKGIPLHTVEVLGGRGSIAPTQSWPWHYMGESGRCHNLAVLYPWGKEPPGPIRLGLEAGWAPEPVWIQRLEEISFAPAGNWIPDQSIDRQYNDWATAAHLVVWVVKIYEV
jgi:hypothetical protein